MYNARYLSAYVANPISELVHVSPGDAPFLDMPPLFLNSLYVLIHAKDNSVLEQLCP